ncbi:MAG: hypothetical protein GXY14_09215 [Spirochaetes bacterium]|nr:hypothetical protein [Spirochaetota bacterium]
MKLKKTAYLPLILGILLNIPLLFVILVMSIFKIHPRYFLDQSTLLFLIQLKLTDVFAQKIEITIFMTALAGFIPLFFYLYNIQVFKATAKIPVKSLILFFAILVSEFVYYFLSIKPGLKYQGDVFVYISILINVVFIGALLWLFYRNYKVPSYMTNLCFNFLLFFWLFWFAFPFFGEMAF